MKRLTVDQTWEQCLAMWKWISRQCKGKSKKWVRANLYHLKASWMKKNVTEPDSVMNDCFFCEYDSKRDGLINNGCFCPARKIDKDFDCMRKTYSYCQLPRLFYAELKRLNKIRLERKSK
jgi:hypothetical protein